MQYDTSGKIKEPNLFKDAGMGAMGAVTSYLKGDMGGVFSSITGVGKKIMSSNSGAAEKSKQMNTSPAGQSRAFVARCRAVDSYVAPLILIT